jgi:hypothetical protein
MCFSSEASLIAGGTLVMAALAMFLRGQNLDLALAGFVLILSVIQFIEWGVHSKVLSSNTAGRSLFLTLMTQCLVMSAGVWWIIGGRSSWALLAISGVGLISAVFVSTLHTYSAKVGNSGHIEWRRDDGALTGKSGVFGVLYLFGIFAPLVVLMFQKSIGPTKPALLIGYGIFSALFVYFYFPPRAFSSMWCFLSLGFAGLLWFMGFCG